MSYEEQQTKGETKCNVSRCFCAWAGLPQEQTPKESTGQQGEKIESFFIE